MSMKSILAEELELISPSLEEIVALKSISKDFIKSLKSVGLTAHIGGSLAKGTMIRTKGKQDVDIFVVFDYSEDILELEKILKKMKLPGKLKRVHGSRDYFQIECGDVVLELIPVVKTSDPELAENVTDVSLRHVKYVGDEIKKKPELADEIRLAKAFCKANRCYGAEGYLRGFSGYSLEVLVIHFGGFVKFLKGVQKSQIIDPLKYFRRERDVLNEINASKLNSPIILVDPTYKYRNVSAGLGLETFEKFLEVANNFLKKPSLDFFQKKELDVEGMKVFAKKKKAEFVELDIKTDRQEGDIAGTKMKKILDFFARELVRKQQQVLMKEFDYEKGKRAKGYLVVSEKSEIELRGPPVGLDDAIRAFKKAKRGKVSKKKGYYWYKEKCGVKKVFELVKKVQEEMGASIKIV